MPRLTFDLSRSFSRIGKAAPTGIDRVERELFGAVAASQPVSALIRSGGRFWAGPGAEVTGTMDAPPAMDWSALAQPWRGAQRRRSESGLRATLGPGAQQMLTPQAPGDWLICLGHSLPHPNDLAIWKRGGGHLAVLVHDLIPLDHPEWARPAPAKRFGMSMAATAEQADIVWHLTKTGQARFQDRFGTQRDQRHQILPMGRTPLPKMEPQPRARPNMLMIGTIEPRKGHALMLDLWQELHIQADLTIIGQRGWMTGEVTEWLDRGPDGVTVIYDADDAQLAQEITDAHCLLFPSLAEGYGLPVMEARDAGLPVIASDLPELRELHGNAITYVTLGDRAAWKLAIEAILHDVPERLGEGTWQRWDQSAQTMLMHLSQSLS